MPDELILCPFERSIQGLRGTVLVRHNRDHMEECVKAIRRRAVPEWSLQTPSWWVGPHDRRQEALREMVRIDEELGLYDTDEKVPPAIDGAHNPSEPSHD